MRLALAVGLTLVSTLLGPTGCTERGALAPPTLEPLEVHVGERWLRDRKGRVVLLRGATFTVTETGMDIGPFGGPGEAALEKMEVLGMNLVRLPLSWALLEPRPGQRGGRYLHLRVDPVIRLAAAHGLAVVLSLRPWPRGRCEDDPTIPDWVCKQTAPFGREQAPCAFWRAGAPKKRPLRYRYAQTWAFVADYYRQDRRVIGFDVLDEPTGSPCFRPDAFLAGHLSPFYELLQRRIRRTGAPQALLYEPAVDADRLQLARPPGDGPVVFSPHVWTQRLGSRPSPLEDAYAEAAREAAALEAPLLVGEFGGNEPLRGAAGSIRGTSRAFALRSLQELDRHLAGGAFFALRPRSEASAAVDLRRLAPILAHPYARRIAGVPTEMTFSPRELTFTLRFEDDSRYAPPDPTEIYLPTREIYQDGFDVRIDPPGRWRFDERTQRLLVYRGDGPSHLVEVRPKAAAD